MIQNKVAEETLSHLMGKVVGKVNIKEPVVRKSNYECAAWYSIFESKTGVFDLRVGEHFHYPHTVQLVSKLPSTITEDYFQSLWCGNPVGDPYDIKKNVGKPGGNILVTYGIDEAIARTGNTPGSSCDLYIEPKYWSDFLSYYRALFEDEIRRLERTINVYRTEGDNSYCSNSGQIGYHGRLVDGISKTIRTISYYIDRFEENTDYKMENFHANTSWAD